MYAFETHPTFEAKVEVTLPDGSTAGDFSARFISLPIDEYLGFDFSTPEGAETFVRKTLMHASDITDLDGNTLVFNVEMKEAMINVAHLRRALVAAYHKAHEGN